MGDNHSPTLEYPRPVRCTTDQLELRDLKRFVNLLEDGVEIRARLDQLGRKTIRLRRGAGILELPRVGHERDVERLRNFRGELNAEFAEDVPQELTRRRSVCHDEIEVAEAAVVVVMIDVDDEVRAVDRSRVGAHAIGLRAIDSDERPLLHVLRQLADQAVELHERVLVRQRSIAREVHDNVLAELAQGQRRREQRAQRVAVGVLVRDDEKPAVLAQRRYDCLQVTRRLRHLLVRAHR